MISNKKRGSKFEEDFAEYLANIGYWVAPFPGKQGSNSQPADMIACQNDKAWLIDCKTLENESGTFTLSRLEENQRLCFKRFYETGNNNYWLAILWKNDVYFGALKMIDLENKKTINVKDLVIIKRGFYEDSSR